MPKLNTWRQDGIIDPVKTKQLSVSLVGAGAIGSETAKVITKMGIENLTVYDEDGVTSHNIPNQFYRLKDAEKTAFKVEALKEIVRDFAGCEINIHIGYYTNQMLEEMVIVATDSMSSRREVWEQFKKQDQCIHYIEARMGAEVFRIYTISRKNGKLLQEDIEFYEETLYSDEQASEAPCSERAIMFTVDGIACFIGRAVKSIIKGERQMREMIVNLAQMEEPSLVFMGRY